MAIKSSTLLGVGRDDDRWSPGFTKLAGVKFFGGMVVTQDPAVLDPKEIKPFAGVINGTNSFPLGLVFENSEAFPPNSDNADGFAGAGHDTLDYARGGKYSVFHRPGNLVDVSDDGRDTTQIALTANNGESVAPQNTSAPFNVNVTYALNDILYATAEDRLVNVAPAAGTVVEIGRVRAINGLAGDAQVFALELQIRVA